MHGGSDPEFRWLERGEGEPVVLLHGLMGIPRAVVGGNSLGGHVALELALSCPDRVSGLILAGSSGLFERGFSRGVPRRPTAEYVRAKLEEVVYIARWSRRDG